MEIKKGVLYSAIFIFVILFMLTFCSYVKADYRITGGTYHDAVVGAKMYTDLYKLDFGLNVEVEYSENFYWEREYYLTGIHNEGNISGGGGFRLRGGYNITEDFRVFLGAGLLVLIDGGDIENLAVSPLYGSLEGGIEYKEFIFGIDHVSSPFHGGDEGDSGINLFYIGIKF